MSRVLKSKENLITQDFGKTDFSNNHGGIDIVGEKYSLDTIVAHTKGTVTIAQDGYGWKSGGTGLASYGNMVEITHEKGFKTRYAHLKPGIYVKKGDVVKQGQALGEMWASRRSYWCSFAF